MGWWDVSPRSVEYGIANTDTLQLFGESIFNCSVFILKFVVGSLLQPSSCVFLHANLVSCMTGRALTIISLGRRYTTYFLFSIF